MTPIQIIGDRTRKSRFDPDLARRVNEEVDREERQRKQKEAKRRAAGLPPETPPAPDTPPAVGASSNFTGDYILMPKANTYALGLHGLQEACKKEKNQNQPQIVLPDKRKVYRANTFLENIVARMNDWETLSDSNGNERTLEDRKRYFATWLDSSCGVAYNSKSTELKLQLICPPLMGIAKDFNEAFLPVDYTSFNGNVTLDSSNNNFARNAWIALLEGKEDVYTNYLKVLKEITGRDIAPNFWKRQNTEKSELRAVCVDGLDSGSFAGGNFLSNRGRFLRRRSP